MVKVIGIDPGTKSYGILGLEDGKVILDTSFSTKNVLKNPHLVINALESIQQIDLVVAPSGLGLPLVPISDLNEAHVFEMTLEKKHQGNISAVVQVARLLKEKNYEGFFIPGVKLLPSVPPYRKINKIDMGTADKVCSAVLAIHDQARNLTIPVQETSFILVEMGSGFNAVLGIDKGKIVDGIGGTMGGFGFLSCGGLDAEVAYLLGEFEKKQLYKGGAAYVAGYANLSIDEFMIQSRKDDLFEMALNGMIDGLLKGIHAMTVSVPSPREIILSGTLVRNDPFFQALIEKIPNIAPVRKIRGLPGSKITKDAAQGAAIIADGLVGGQFEPLIDNLEMKKAHGSNLDSVFLEGIERFRMRRK
ncbi:MAG: DUF1464 family protein [Candidatus Helarchaeota archaeon]